MALGAVRLADTVLVGVPGLAARAVWLAAELLLAAEVAADADAAVVEAAPALARASDLNRGGGGSVRFEDSIEMPAGG